MTSNVSAARNQLFGRHLRRHWLMQEGASFLNHGSFGACPKAVLAAQSAIREEMERAPDQFFRQRIMPQSEHSAMRPVAQELAKLVGTNGERLAFVENATSGVCAVLECQEFGVGDEILILDHTYNAVRLAVEHHCRKTGASCVTARLPIPATPENLVEAILAAVTPRTRLAVLDHITSASALLLPLENIVPELRAKGVRVLVDGAHCVGQIALNLEALGADYYVSNAHKWLFAPKGSAFLYARPENSETLIPLAVSHYNHTGFPARFHFVGTRDVSSWLSVPSALKFIEKIGGFSSMQCYCRALAIESASQLKNIGAVPVASEACTANMRTFQLPQRRAAQTEDGAALMTQLWQRHKIQIVANVLGGRFLMRLSAQVYVDAEEFEQLAQTLEIDGWPGR